jgi:hypothetical protein
LLNNLISFSNKALVVIYFGLLLLACLIGFLRYFKLSENLKVLFYLINSILIVEIIGLVFNFLSWSNNLVYIFFDFSIANLILFFYVLNLFSKVSKCTFLIAFGLNFLLFVLCYFLFKDISDFDFTYTLIYTFSILTFSVLLYWKHLGLDLQKKDVIILNFFFLYNITMALINKFIVYYCYFERPYYIFAAQNFTFIYNIIGFVFSIKLLLSKNEN